MTLAPFIPFRIAFATKADGYHEEFSSYVINARMLHTVKAPEIGTIVAFPPLNDWRVVENVTVENTMDSRGHWTITVWLGGALEETIKYDH